MKPNHTAAVFSGVFLAALLFGTQFQQRRLSSLRTQIEERISEQSRSMASAKLDTSATTGVAPELSAAEQAELLALRRDVGQLRRQKPNLDKLQAENASLRAVLAKADSPASEAYLSKSRARFVGLAAPGDTLQSFLFAIRSRDTNVLFQVLGTRSLANLAAEFEGRGVEQFFNTMSPLAGFRIVQLAEQPDGSIDAELQIDPRSNMESIKFPLVNVNGEWRLEIAAAR